MVAFIIHIAIDIAYQKFTTFTLLESVPACKELGKLIN